jgi:hypothetical protein
MICDFESDAIVARALCILRDPAFCKALHAFEKMFDVTLLLPGRAGIHRERKYCAC